MFYKAKAETKNQNTRNICALGGGELGAGCFSKKYLIQTGAMFPPPPPPLVYLMGGARYLCWMREGRGECYYY